MLNLSELLKFYPDHLHSFKRFILREYLQHKILEIVFEHKLASKLCFMGGTCLRIVHDNNRFSEDLDFDNFGLSQADFETLATSIEKQLHRAGYETEIRNVYKGAYHCYIKFPKLLFEQGLSGHQEEKILIQIDPDVDLAEIMIVDGSARTDLETSPFNQRRYRLKEFVPITVVVDDGHSCRGGPGPQTRLAGQLDLHDIKRRIAPGHQRVLGKDPGRDPGDLLPDVANNETVGHFSSFETSMP